MRMKEINVSLEMNCKPAALIAGKSWGVAYPIEYVHKNRKSTYHFC